MKARGNKSFTDRPHMCGNNGREISIILLRANELVNYVFEYPPFFLQFQFTVPLSVFILQSFPCFPSTMAWWCRPAGSWIITAAPSPPPRHSPSPLPEQMKARRRRRSTAVCLSPAQVSHSIEQQLFRKTG